MSEKPTHRIVHPRGKQWWRAVLSVLCIVIATIAMVVMIAAQYTRDNVLSTERFVEIVSPLPQQAPVANALANYTTTALFNAVDTEAALKGFLPPKLEPLAVPLTATLKQKTTEVTRDFIKSDNFSAIWVGANRILHKNLMQIADKDLAKNHPTNVNKATNAVANLDLDGLVGEVEKRFGSDTTVVNAAHQAQDLQVNLQQDIEQLQTTVSIIKTSAYVLPYVLVAFMLMAIALAFNRRHAVVAVGITTVLMGAALLIAFKVGSQGFFANIDNGDYRAAAQVVYEAFYGDLRHRITGIMWGGGIITVLAILSGPYAWAVWLRTTLRITEIQKSIFYAWARTVRKYTRQLFWWLFGGGVAIILTILLARSHVTPSTLVVFANVLLAYTALLVIMAWPSPSRRHVHIASHVRHPRKKHQAATTVVRPSAKVTVHKPTHPKAPGHPTKKKTM